MYCQMCVLYIIIVLFRMMLCNTNFLGRQHFMDQLYEAHINGQPGALRTF